MKSITDLTSNLNPRQLIESSRQSSEQPTSREEQVINLLWVRLAEIYGQGFVTQYGEMPSRSWKDLLRGISPDQIKSGLEKLTKRESSFPPNAIEFRQLCIPPTISPNGGNSDAYLSIDDPRHSCYRPKRTAIEDLGKKEKQARAAKETLNNLKGLFK